MDPGKDSSLARALQPISVTPLSSIIIAELTDKNMSDDMHSSIYIYFFLCVVIFQTHFSVEEQGLLKSQTEKC